MKRIIVEHISLHLQMAVDIKTLWEAIEKNTRQYDCVSFWVTYRDVFDHIKQFLEIYSLDWRRTRKKKQFNRSFAS